MRFLHYFISTLFLFFSITQAKAQITGAEIRGEITDETGLGLPGVVVSVIHQPTGTTYNLVSDINGAYYLTNLKPGGPYQLSYQYISYAKEQKADVFLRLGESKSINISLKPKVNELATVDIVSSKKDAQERNKKGTATNVDLEQMEKLPTLNRSLQDMTRVSPQTAGNSYGGANYRYNNLSIDGVASNDAFGFQEPGVGAGGSTAAGSPGALSKTQPISLDAVSEIQISTAPYDVKLGNFTGGSLNVVTRSGTNTTEGSVYNFTKSNAFTGRSPYKSREKIERFSEYQTGFRLGGALQKNKLFYFINFENTRRSEPLLFAPGSKGSVFDVADISALRDTVLNRYGYDLGNFGSRNLTTENNKLFFRLDYNLNENTQLVLRHNIVKATHENLSRSGTVFNYESQGFVHNSTTNSTVAEVKSRLGQKVFNNLILGYSTIHDFRDPLGELFPHIEINYNTAGTIFAGSYREASVFQMNQSSYELSDNLTIYSNKHKITLGTHNEMYQFGYHFVTPYTGRWAYNSLDDFYANMPSRIRGTYSLTDDSYDYNYNNPSADFRVILSSIYAQDDFTVNDKLKVSIGLRFEGNLFLDSQNYSSEITSSQNFGQFGQDINNTFLVSPRIGFNYSPNSWMKVRGGSGIFAGRMPFAWAAYSHIYSGSQFGSVDVRPTGPVDLITDDYSQLGNLQPGKKEINIVDPNYKLPRVLRSSLAFDVNLPHDYKLTVEGVYTKTIYDIYFQNINLKDSSTTFENPGNDNRPIYLGSGDEQRVDNNFANVFLLTNTRLGYRYQASVSIAKNFSENLSVMAAYTYGVSKDLMNGVRVSPQANWGWNQTVDSRKPALSFSNFDLRHRVIASANYTLAYNEKWKTVFSVFGIANSGTPFTYIYAGDINRDASSVNDLIYVPNSAAEINLVDIKDGQGNILVSKEQQWRDLDEYIKSDDYLSSRRGDFTERNGGRTPWNIQVDLHLGQDFTIQGKNGKHIFTATADIFNFTNLLNYRWGRQYFVPNTTNAGYSLINVKTDADGEAKYTFTKPKSEPYQIDGIASRLQMQIGLRYTF